MIPFFIGLILGILLSAIAIAWEVSKDKPTLVWMDEDYKLHLVKKRR